MASIVSREAPTPRDWSPPLVIEIEQTHRGQKSLIGLSFQFHGRVGGQLVVGFDDRTVFGDRSSRLR